MPAVTLLPRASRPGPSVLQRLLGFALLPLLSAVSPLLVLPVIVRSGGIEDWTAVGVGTAVGSVGAALGFVGWSVRGTAAVATTADPAERLRLYALGFWTRTVVLAGMLPLVAVVAGVVGPDGHRVTTAVCAVAFVLPMTSFSWFSIGRGAPWEILLHDAGPRTVASVAAAVVVLCGGSVLWYPVLLVVASAGGLLSFHLRLLGRPLPPPPTRPELTAAYRANASAWVTEAGYAWGSLPVLVAANVLGIRGAAQYIAADRLYRYGSLGITSLGNALQSWVLAEGSRRRHGIAIAAHALFGLAGAAVLVLGGATVTRLLFGGEVVPDGSVWVPLGIAFACISTSTPLVRNVLVPRGQGTSVAVIVVGSGASGTLLMVLLGSTLHDPAGVAWGFAANEVVALAAGVLVALARRRGAAVRPGAPRSSSGAAAPVDPGRVVPALVATAPDGEVRA